MNKNISIVIFTYLLNLCVCKNILYISTTPSPSHQIWDKTIALSLRERHHSITFVSHSVEKFLDNFTSIHLEDVYEKLSSNNQNLTNLLHFNSIQSIVALLNRSNNTCYYDLQTNGLKRLVNQATTGVKYDLILFDMTTGHCLYPIIELFGSPPVIGTSPYGLIQYFTFPFGIDLNIAYNPLNFLSFTDDMTYFERVSNLFHTLFFLYWRQYVHMPAQQKLAEEYFGKNVSSIIDIERKFQLLLTNTDPVFDYPQPIPPAVVQVGGLHTKRAKSLPHDLQQYLDRSEHGIIYFAFGTNIRASSIGEDKIKSFIQTFFKLKENVLWKFEAEIENLPKNVLIRNWLPQNDILAHPKVKLFITHGGGLSTQEAMYHGVPVIGIPFFIDQHVNMKKMVNRKLGLKVDFTNITTEYLLASIHEILHNPEYKSNVKIISERYKSRSEDALSRAVNAIEYVLKFGGEHLRINAKDMSFIKLHLLDIWIPLASIVYILFKLLKTMCKCLLKRFQTGNFKQTTKHKIN